MRWTKPGKVKWEQEHWESKGIAWIEGHRRVQSIHLALLSWICIVSRKRDLISLWDAWRDIAADLQWERTENRDIMIVCTKYELFQIGRTSITMLTRTVQPPAMAQPIRCGVQWTPFESQNFDWSIATWFSDGHDMISAEVMEWQKSRRQR